MNTESVHKKATRQLLVLLILLGCTLIASLYYAPTRVKQPAYKEMSKPNRGLAF